MPRLNFIGFHYIITIVSFTYLFFYLLILLFLLRASFKEFTYAVYLFRLLLLKPYRAVVISPLKKSSVILPKTAVLLGPRLPPQKASLTEPVALYPAQPHKQSPTCTCSRKKKNRQVRNLAVEKKDMVLVTVCYSRTLYGEEGAFLPIISF